MNSLKQLGVVFVALAVLLTAGTAGALTPAPTGVDRVPDARTDAIAQPLSQNSPQQQPDDRSAEDVLQAAQQSYSQIESVNATVVATTEISNGTTSVSNTTKAKLSFERPDKFRVELLAPAEQAGTVIVSNGTTITFYDPTTDTARTVNASVLGGASAMGPGSMGSGMMGQAPTGSFGQVGALNQSNVTFEGTATVNGRETFVLSVAPENTSEGFSSEQTLYLDQESYIPLKIVSETSTTVRGETTTITSTILVQNLQVNEDIPDSVFEFDTPSDADDGGEPTDDGTDGDDMADDDAGEDETPGDAPADSELGENDKDDDSDGAVDEDDEDPSDAPSNDDDDGDGAIDEDDEPDDGDDGSDDFNGEAEDDDDGDGHFDEDDEADGGNSDDEDNDGDGAVDEDDEPDNDD